MYIGGRQMKGVLTLVLFFLWQQFDLPLESPQGC